MQGLPTDFNNTAAVWDNIPAFAALQAGQNNAYAQENNDALQRAFQGEQDFEAQKRPVELSNLVATGDNTRATTGHTLAQTTGLNLKNQTDVATQASDIAAKNSKNNTQITADQLANLTNFGEIAGQTAAKIADPSMPGWQKAQIVKEAFGDKLPDNPAIMQALATNADRLPQMLQAYSERARQATASYKSEREKLDNAKAVAGIHAGAQIKVAQMNIDAGKFANRSASKAQDLVAQAQAGKLSYEKAATAFQIMSELEADPQKAQQYAEMAAKFEQAKLDAANASGGSKVDLSAMPGTKIPSLKPTPGLGKQAPKMGTAENPIVLK